MEKIASFIPVRLSSIEDNRYELEVIDSNGIRHIVICTVVEGDVNHIVLDPNIFSHSITDPRPIYKAIYAFHNARR
jgi:hypothetical protein